MEISTTCRSISLFASLWHLRLPTINFSCMFSTLEIPPPPFAVRLIFKRFFFWQVRACTEWQGRNGSIRMTGRPWPWWRKLCNFGGAASIHWTENRARRNLIAANAIIAAAQKSRQALTPHRNAAQVRHCPIL